ncbi:MAG TPA: hypothetical protein VGM05_29665 [Planctomycetaceae bacterium]|jgi:hypothetical protein
MSARQFLVCIGLLATLAAGAFPPAESKPAAPSVAPLQQSRSFAVHVSEIGGSFDLAFDPRDQYELIVSSLGDASQTFHVQLEAAPRAAVERFPAVPVAPLSRTAAGWAVPTSAYRTELPRETVGTARPAGLHSTRSQAQLGNVSSAAPLREIQPDRFHHPAASDSSRRRFFLHVTAGPLEDPGAYVPITGVLAGEGQHVRIYVDSDLSAGDLAPELVSETIRLLDAEIIPRSRELIGIHADVDGDDKLAVLVTPWLGRLCGGRVSLNGCVRSNDFQIGMEAPFGNSADLLYLNSHLESGPTLKTLLAHEYTHAVCFSRRCAQERGSLPLEDDWLNEAIAYVAENLHETGWSNLEDRIAGYLAAPHRSPLVVRDYYCAGLWRDPGCRGATYLFLRFCVDQFGPELLGELVRSPLTGLRNLEQATGIPFRILFRHWTIALANDEIATVPLRSTLGNRQLSGVSRINWHIDNTPCPVELHGTTMSLIRLETATCGVRRIAIHAPPAAQLQMTLLRRRVPETPAEAAGHSASR